MILDSSTLNREIQLIVKAARDEYSISASSSTLLMAQGYSVESVITARVLPLTDMVNEGVPMLTSFVSTFMETQGSLPSVGFTPMGLARGYQTVTVTVPQDVPPGNYTIGVVATWYPGTEENETRQNLIPLTVVTPSVIPHMNPQTTNATLEYDLTNRLSENGTTCTYAWGPMFTISPTSVVFRFNFSSTSPIDVYVFSSDDYNGILSCSLAPSMRYNEPFMTGTHDQFVSMCMDCSQQTSYYVLFINHDPTLTPHVTLEVAVKLSATTTTTKVSPPPSPS
jgi:hypothetical protein